MFEISNQLKEEVSRQISEDKIILAKLREEIRPLRHKTRRIQPRSTAAISLVATDGGNNQLRFDPFLVQLVRVVDSSNNQYCLEAVSPTMSISRLSERQFAVPGEPTALGSMMRYLGVDTLSELSHVIRSDKDGRNSPRWVKVYRELVEWAILFHIVRNKDFANDTLIVFDGFLRSKVFARDLFQKYRKGIQEGIDSQWSASRRRIYLVGIAKHSKVLSRYRLAMVLEGVMQSEFPCYVEISRELEEKAYESSEYARGDEFVAEEGAKINRFVAAGKMFFVKFGGEKLDPIWPVDIFASQWEDHQEIFGYLLNDATEGFPMPFYPRSLQKAHESAALVDFDKDILQDAIFNCLRATLGDDASALDVFRLQDADPASRRYE